MRIPICSYKLTIKPRAYSVDLGDKREKWSKKKMRDYYAHNVNHAEYKDFEEWFIDMAKTGLIIPRFI